jgi:hypothetical protein
MSKPQVELTTMIKVINDSIVASPPEKAQNILKLKFAWLQPPGSSSAVRDHELSVTKDLICQPVSPSAKVSVNSWSLGL